MKPLTPVILRIDDIGASSKQFEQYGKSPFKLGATTLPFPLASFGVMKRMPLFQGWGPYREMTPKDWHDVFDLLARYDAKLTVCITATWVEKDSSLTPFPQKFPELVPVLKEGQKAGLIEIGNHGLTHCVVGQHLPNLFRGNRSMHREFWGWLPDETHQQHLRDAQAILTDTFGEITTLTPPGNQWTDITEKAAKEHGLRFISARFPTDTRHPSLIWANKHTTYAFHDRELVLIGVSWLENLLKELQEKGERGTTVKELYGT